MLFMEIAESGLNKGFSGINKNINKLFTLALSGWFWEKRKMFIVKFAQFIKKLLCKLLFLQKMLDFVATMWYYIRGLDKNP